MGKMALQIIPAIDLMNGECVRLEQGDPSRKKVYNHQPEEVAKEWVRQGAERLHVVDLDGAFKGSLQNLESVCKIREAVDAQIELGGGLREVSSIQQAFDVGVNYCIIGSRACQELTFLENTVQRFGERIILGVDARNGMVSTHGWKKTSTIPAADFIAEASTTGVTTVIFTDISRDGMLRGTNLESIRSLAQQFPALKFISSGGVSNLDDIRRLAGLDLPNLIGVIIGKALYEDTLSLTRAISYMKEHNGNGR